MNLIGYIWDAAVRGTLWTLYVALSYQQFNKET